MLDNHLSEMREIKDREVKNKKYELFDSIDIEAVVKAVDNLIQSNIDTYIAYKFLANNVIYIRSEDEEEMIRNVTKTTVIELSELYIHYISLLYAIQDTEQLTQVVYKIVKNKCIRIVSDYNQVGDDSMSTILL